jgi:hypothetical protein
VRTRVGGDEDGCSGARSGFLQGTDDERGAGRGGDTADDIGGADPATGNLCGSVLASVFGTLLGTEDGGFASGDDCLDQLRRGAEGRRTLGGVQDA